MFELQVDTISAIILVSKMGTFVKRDSFRTQKMALLVLNDPTI